MGDVVLGSNLEFAVLRGRPGWEVPVSDPGGPLGVGRAWPPP